MSAALTELHRATNVARVQLHVRRRSPAVFVSYSSGMARSKRSTTSTSASSSATQLLHRDVADQVVVGKTAAPDKGQFLRMVQPIFYASGWL